MSSSPDPRDPSSFNHRHLKVSGSGHTYHFVDQAPIHWKGPVADAPTVLLLHGFPDLWYGYRYQIFELASRGYRVICPSALGYAGSSKPKDVSKYSWKALSYDLNGLLDVMGVTKKIVVVGHDWGGMTAWRFGNYFPDRVLAIACVCTPYQAPASPTTPYFSDEEIVKRFLPQFGYQLYFKSPDSASEMDEVVDQFLQPMHSPNYRRGYQSEKRPDGEMGNWVKEGRLQASILKLREARRAGNLPEPPLEPELDYYIKTYREGGLEGPLSFYKTRETNYKEERAANLPPFPSHIPCLQLPAELDAALPPSMCLSPAVMKCFPAGNLEVKIIDGGDHWCLQDEKVRDKVTETLANWIDRVVSGKWTPTLGTPMVSHL